MQPFEQVWVLFEDVLKPMYEAQDRDSPTLVIDLLGYLEEEDVDMETRRFVR